MKPDKLLTDKEKEEDNRLVLNYLTIRTLIGVFAFILPVICVFYSLVFTPGGRLEISISHYYYTPVRNVFVGVLCVTALFLICYKGYKFLWDGLASTLAGIFALGVAFFPTSHKAVLTGDCPWDVPAETVTGMVHLIASALFFVTLAAISIFIFTKEDNLTSREKWRNRVYKICGTGMVICVLLMFLYFKIDWIFCKLYKYKFVFWMELAGLWLFGISWAVKGEAILKK